MGGSRHVEYDCIMAYHSRDRYIFVKDWREGGGEVIDYVASG